MRIISKQISLNNITSKVPGVIPSLIDSWKVKYLGRYIGDDERYYSYQRALDVASEYNINKTKVEYFSEFLEFNKKTLTEFSTGNYGLIPSDVIIPSEIAYIITDYTDIYVNLPDENGNFYDLSWPKNSDDPHYEGRKIISGGTEVKVLTYYTLNKWYAFFKEYYDLISNSDHVRTYESAVDYYNSEYDVKNDELLSQFEEMDSIFNSRGGEEMYQWISNNCIIQYIIPKKFVNAWKTSYLYYPDAIKWNLWFEERNEKYKDITCLEDCKNTDNCCESKEYFLRGGHEFYQLLHEWLENIKEPDKKNFTMSASITIPISITNSIDDLGEMSIFSTEWEGGVDYHDTLSGNSGGTVVINPDDNETYIIKGGSTKGYEYDTIYLENVFKENDWNNYTNYYISGNPGLFANEIETVTSYTYSPLNGKIIYNPQKIESSIDIIKKNIVFINGGIYDVIDGKYVELCYNSAYIGGRKNSALQIFNDGELQYAVLNGIKKFVEVDDNGDERIYFLKDFIKNDEGCKVEEASYIVFNNVIYFVEDDKVNLKDNDFNKTYPVLDGYFIFKENTFYISGDTIVVYDDKTYSEENDIYDDVADIYNYTQSYREPTENELYLLGIESMSVDNDKVIISHTFTATTCDILSGYSDSKLELLRRKEITTDDLGNELPGYFKSVVDINSGENQSIYNNPYDESTLDILYKVGEVSYLEPLDNTVFGENHFHGNIITDIEFYYSDEFGNKKISNKANDDNALDIIAQCEAELSELNDDSVSNTLLCDITYHIGATIKKVGTEYSLDDNFNTGVKYIDTLYVSKKTGIYYMNSKEMFTYSYYLLQQNIQSIVLSDFNDAISWNKSYFEFKPYLYHIVDNNIVKPSDLVENNGMIVSPLFRSDFNLATSFPQNVEGDIYIDRGINSAFEKHLKLQEVRTVEALENYGNSWFNINKY